MKVIKWIIILIVFSTYAFSAVYVMNACAMINNYVYGCSMCISGGGLMFIYLAMRRLYHWFDSDLLTHNVKTNEENSNTPS